MDGGGLEPQHAPAARRIAFQPFGGAGWLGGLHYLSTLLSALDEHAAADVEALLFASASTDRAVLARLRPFLRRDPIPFGPAAEHSGRGSRLARSLGDGLRLRASSFEQACRQGGVDVVFQHAGWLGSRFGLPTVAWLGDFQHRVLPEMFGRRLAWRRELRFQAVLRSATLLYVLSDADRRLGETYYPRAAHKLRALPFAVGLPPEAFSADPMATVRRFGLPERFFLFPGQLWRHKNHLAVIEAVARVKDRDPTVTVVSCGNPVDHRDLGHGPRVRARIAELGLGDQFRLLGVVPRPDMWALARASTAILNPSLYEGWSTPVEEAKAIGAPLLLSDLPVHREQRPAETTFFDPRDPDAIAAALLLAWREHGPGPRPDAEQRAATALVGRRRAFAAGFVALATEAAALGPRA